jgi:serine/threonine-protein kinase HipA
MKRTPSHQKAVENVLHVHADRSDGVHYIGTLSLDESTGGHFFASFSYSQQWLENPQGFALDPINLPLRSGSFETTSKYISLGALFDAAPDLWGRRVLRATNEHTEEEGKILLKGRGNGVGCLLFAKEPTLTRKDLPGFETLPTVEDDLQAVHEAVYQVHSNAPPTAIERIQKMLGGSWSMGGARAKAVMRDKDGGIWLAKFSEPDDSIDRQRIELANLLMADAIGMKISPSKVLDTRLGSVFMTRRFDRTESLDRHHYVSAISLVSAEPQSKRFDTPRDKAIFSYARLSDIVSRVSKDPVRERKELFARMALNACVRNTDDHLKNLGFIMDDDRQHYSLAPVFDVVTQTQPQHFLRIGAFDREGSLRNVVSEPRAFGLTKAGAEEIAERVAAVVRRRKEFYERVGLCQDDIEAVDALIEPRCPAQPDGELQRPTERLKG